MNKKSLTEADIRTKFITPAIEAAGWDKVTQMREEYFFTAGRITVRGKLVARGQGKKADYLLYGSAKAPIAVVEAKDNNHPVAGGIPQALGYLNARGIAINAMFFQVFPHGDDKFLSRAWLIDPGETQINAATTVEEKAQKQDWNGEYYAAFGDAES